MNECKKYGFPDDRPGKLFGKDVDTGSDIRMVREAKELSSVSLQKEWLEKPKRNDRLPI